MTVSFRNARSFLFGLNLKTAKALGITIPESILLRADEMIPVSRFILLLAVGAHPLSSAFQRPLTGNFRYTPG